MTTPTIDPRLVHALSTQVHALQHQLGRVGHDLGVLQSQLAPAVTPAIPQTAPVARPVPASGHPFRPSPQRSPRVPWWQRDGMVSRLLAVAGAGVTLIGVVMLVVLAAQSGWFGPQLRVASGAVLSASLIGVAHRMQSRPGGRVGAVALAATGVAGLYLVVAAMTAVYGWLTPVVGLVIALGVAAIGIAIAVQWATQHLAVSVIVGIALLAPVVTGGLTGTLLALLFVVQLAASAVDVRRDWMWVRIARTVPVTAAVLLATVLAELGSTTSERIVVLAVAAASMVVALTTCSFSLRRPSVDVASLATAAATALTVLVAASLVSRPLGATVQGLVAAVALAVIVFARNSALPARVTFGGVASVAAMAAVLNGTPEDLRVAAVLAMGLVLMVSARATRSVWVFAAGSLFGGVGLLGHYDATSIDVLTSWSAAAEAGALSVLGSVLVLATAVAGARAVPTVISGHDERGLGVAVCGVVGLYAVTAITVVVGAGLGSSTGFFVGHGVATITWMAVAVAVLLRGVSRRGATVGNAQSLLMIGLALATAAVAKLFLFDLGQLAGLPRAAAFLVVGMMLLGVGTRYARAFAERGSSAETVTDAAGGPVVR